MAYKRYIWVDEESQLDAYHLNNIEDGLEGIIDGDLTVDKANKDGDGNIITGSYGSNINFEFDNSTGMVTLKLLAKDGSILQTSSIDLPTEYLIKEIYLDDIDKNLVFVLSNDTEIKCDISAIYDKIDTKVDKVEDSSTFNRAYGVDTNGKQKMFNISKAPNDSALGQYTSAGNLVTNDPTAVLHAANKRYVDNTSNNLKSTIPTDINVDSNHKLILEHDGVEIPNQNKKATLPPFNIENSMVKLYDANNKIQGFQVGSPTEHRFSYLNQSVIGMDWEPVHCTFYLSNSIVNPSVYVRVWTTDNNSQSGRIKIPYKDGTMALIEDLANYTPISETNNIKALIPPQASKDNQLADKNFVNSSINSSAAYFIGSFATYADLLKWQNDNPTKATNNDYAYVEQDETHNNEGWRYIYVKTEDETVGTWKPQFKVNDTPFTAAQLAAINSNITSDKVTTFDNHVANKENPHSVTKEQVGLGNVDNTSDLDKPISNATSTALEDLNKVMPTDINVDSNHKLILEHDGTEITGQKKQVLIPPFIKDGLDYALPYDTITAFALKAGLRLIARGDFRIGDGDNNQNLVFNKNRIQYYDETDANKSWGIGVDNKDYSFHIVHNANSDVGGDSYITSSDWDQDIVFPRKSGTVALTEDVDDVIKIFDFTSLDFTNVLNTLEDEGYVDISITNEAMENDLKTIFDRLQNNKTSFIELPQLQSGAGSAESIQQTRMFALIQNSIYLGTGVYGLYGLMYFYRSFDMLIKIRISTNFNGYYAITLTNVEKNFVEKSSNKKVVYTNDNTGTPSTINYSVSPNNSAIAQFNSTGQLYTNKPTENIHAANKQYVDDITTNKLDVITYNGDNLTLETDKTNPLPDDLKTLLTPYINAKKPFVLRLNYVDSDSCEMYYVKSFNGATTNGVELISFEADTTSQYYMWIELNTNEITYFYVGFASSEEVDNKLNKQIRLRSVYATDGNANQTMFYWSVNPEKNAIAMFDNNGVLRSNAPTNDTDVANKKYVDDLTTNKLDVIIYEKELSYTGDRGTLPDDLKALIKPYYDAKKPFILKHVYDSENTLYYLKAYDGNSDGEVELYCWEVDTQNQLRLLIDLQTNTFVFDEYYYALYEYVVHSNSNKKVVYANDENGRQNPIPYSLLPGESNIAQFDTNGHLYTNDPSIDSHCANKKYVDSAIENNLPYGTNADIDNMF